MLVSLAIIITVPRPAGIRTFILATILRFIFSVGLEPTLWLLGALNVSVCVCVCVCVSVEGYFGGGLGWGGSQGGRGGGERFDEMIVRCEVDICGVCLHTGKVYVLFELAISVPKGHQLTAHKKCFPSACGPSTDVLLLSRIFLRYYFRQWIQRLNSKLYMSQV